MAEVKNSNGNAAYKESKDGTDVESQTGATTAAGVVHGDSSKGCIGNCIERRRKVNEYNQEYTKKNPCMTRVMTVLFLLAGPIVWTINRNTNMGADMRPP